MKARELRIGNIIQDINYPERKCQVFRLTCGIDFSITYQYDKRFEMSYPNDQSESLQPIPLTEDWLLRFGFEKKIGGTQTFINNFMVWVNEDETLVDVYYFGHRIAIYTHVHQLQNLYFALTGEELTLKPDTQ